MYGDPIKYVVIDKRNPIVFGPCTDHDSLEHSGNITSAGFFTITQNEPHRIQTYGESTTLSLKPSPEDAKLIRMMLFPNEDNP